MTTFLIRHETVYRYKSPVAFGEHRLMLRARDGYDQRTVSHQLEISPEPAHVGWAEDPSGNLVGTASFARRGRELRIVAAMRVEHTAFDPAALAIAEHAQALAFSYGAEEVPDLARFIERQQADPERALDRWAREVRADATGTWDFLLRLNAGIRRDFAYLRREEPGIQSPAKTLKIRRGTCRDFAVLMSEAVRTQGIAARFVSGYLHVKPVGDVPRTGGGSTHAWLQVYLPGAGWIDFDPTSGTVGNADLVRVAVVRDPDQASPLSGTFMGFPSDYLGMSVSVDVTVEASAKERSVAA